MVDTGCGYDLVSKKQADGVTRWKRQASTPRTFQTANGVATADQVARMTIGEYKEDVSPYIRDSTPAMLSGGYRCMNLGCSFIWPKGENPYFVLPNGQVCQLKAKRDVPHVCPGDSSTGPRETSHASVFECICEDVAILYVAIT